MFSFSAENGLLPGRPYNMKQTQPIEKPFITLKDITIRIRDRFILPHTCWEIKTHQHWVILGPNGAGKSVLVRALAGELPVVRGNIIHHHGGLPKASIGYVSFERHRQVIDQDEARDESRFFSGNLEHITTVRQVIFSGNHINSFSQKGLNQVAGYLQVRDLFDRGIRFLSTGELRKVLMVKALMNRPRLLILDEPFDGMDIDSSAWLTKSINNLINKNVQIILVTHRLEEIPSNISHVLCLDNGKVIMQGKRENVLNNVEHLYKGSLKQKKVFLMPKHFQKQGQPPANQQKILIFMKKVTVKYGGIAVLNNLHWTVKQGENWAIVGPNGAGKSTLLSLITGDNPQAYANEICLFGRPRGSGETIWEIKKLIGVVSASFQIRYRKPLTAFEVMLSGFYDSVGLYQSCTPAQRRIVEKLTGALCIENLVDKIFDQLSYGEQRIVLLARSMVKSPLILILDEPCEGLNRMNREQMLGLFDFIGTHTRTQLLYVTHHPEEIPPCITHVLQFEKRANGRFVVSPMLFRGHRPHD